MDAEARRIRQGVGRVDREAGSGTRRYPETLRDAVVRYARGGREEGESVRAIAGRLGVPVPTLSLWLAESRNGCFRPVRVAGGEGVRTVPALISPEGYRVEGLALADLVAVLRALR